MNAILGSQMILIWTFVSIFVLQIYFAYSVCCIYSNAFQNIYTMEENTMNPGRKRVIFCILVDQCFIQEIGAKFNRSLDQVKSIFFKKEKEQHLSSAFCMLRIPPKAHSLESINIGPVKQFLQRKIVIIFLPISINICFGAQKNRLIETVLLSTHNICFG